MNLFDWIENFFFYSALLVLFWYGWSLTVNRGIPNIKTAPAIRKKMLEFIREDMRKKNKETYIIMDLGSGSGHLSRYLARQIPEAKVIGVEISKMAFWSSVIRAKLCGLQNLEYKNEDLKKTDLSQADALTMFLSCLLMTPIREAIEKSVSKDTLITSNKFPLGGKWEPEEILEVETLYPHQRRLYVYHS